MLKPRKNPQPFRRLYIILLSLFFAIGAPIGLGALGGLQNGPEEIREEARNHFQKAQQFRADRKPEEADIHYSRAQQLYRQLQDWSIVVTCAIYRSQINYDLNRTDSLKLILEEAQDIIDQKELREEHFKQERIFFFRALYLEKTAQYQAASDMLDKATPILANLDQLIGLDSAYLASHKALSGSIYYERRDLEMAINHYLAALTLFPDSRPDVEKLVTVYNNLGLAFIEMEQVKKGMEYLEKSLSILPGLDQNMAHEDFLQTYFNLVRGFLDQNQFSEADQYLSLADKLLIRHQEDRHIWYSLKAQLQEQQGLLPQALSNYQAAFEARKKVRGALHPSVAKVQLAIGLLSVKMGQQQEALAAFQKGLQVFDQQLDNRNFFETPNLKNINDYYLLIQLLRHRGNTLKALYPKQIEEVLPTFRVAIQAIDSLRLLYESDASKLLLSKEAKSVFASALELLHQQYQDRPDPKILEETFYYMEKSKALLLLENIRKWRNIRLQRPRAGKAGDRFTKLLEEEKNAKLDLILIQRTIEDLQQRATTAAPGQLDNLQNELQRISSQYQFIKSILSDSFPQYYQASYGDKVANIAQIQQGLLSGDQTYLLTYFIFEDQSFAMRIGQDTVIFHALPQRSSWAPDFEAYQNTLRTQGKALLQNETYQSYLSSATRLYNFLLKDLLQNVEKSAQSLYLIPDDILGFLAFESLLVSSPSKEHISYDLEHQDYLIEHYALAYGYSATILLESLNKNTGADDRADYGGFAPVFQEGGNARAVSRDCTTGSLMYLPYSEKSVRETQQMMEGTAYLHEQASLENFKNSANKYRILQLATHACVDEQDALFNVIYFHDTTLATYEIFDIPIRADLVILSACETGNGDLLAGEGIMSLSRGFYYAGSTNIVTSLWPADDYATQNLMVRFNQYLKDGVPKDQALQNAKLDYLRSPTLRNLGAAPAFWANFILIGNQNAIELDIQGTDTWQLFLLPFLGLALVLTFMYGLSWRKT